MRWRGKGSKLSRALELYDRRPPRGGPLGRITTSRIRQRGGAPLPPSAARRPAGSAGAAEPRRGQAATRARESPNRVLDAFILGRLNIAGKRRRRMTG